MAIDSVPSSERVVVSPEGRGGAWTAVIVVLAVLVIGEVYSLSKISSLGSSIQAQQVSARKDTQQANEQLAAKFASLQDSNAQQLDALRNELDQTAKSMGTNTKSQLNRARALVAKLQKDQQTQGDQLRLEIAKKADDEKVGALSQDMASTKTDLSTTKKTVDTLTNDLGMARSEMGTLIARNHDDIETLRKLGQRNYYEFTLTKNQEQKVAGIGLILKKTNAKRHTFNLDMLADDAVIAKKARTIDEPIFFAPSNSKSFYELVINKVGQDTATGYMSTPKYGEQLAQAAPAETSPADTK